MWACAWVCVCVYVYTVHGLLPHQWISALLNVTLLDGERSLALSNGMLLWRLKPFFPSPDYPFPFSYLASFYSIPFLLTCVFFPCHGFTLRDNGKHISGTITSKDTSLRHYLRNELERVVTCIHTWERFLSVSKEPECSVFQILMAWPKRGQLNEYKCTLLSRKDQTSNNPHFIKTFISGVVELVEVFFLCTVDHTLN